MRIVSRLKKASQRSIYYLVQKGKNEKELLYLNGEKKIKAANAALANRGASTSEIEKNSVGNEEFITPDIESGPSSSLMSTSAIVIKQEIIETEEEPNLFDDSSFADNSIETDSDRQTPSTSYSNAGTPPVAHGGSMAPTVPHNLSIVKFESDISSKFCTLSNAPSTLNVTSSDVSSPIPTVLSKACPGSNTGPNPSGVSSRTGSPSLSQVFSSPSLPSSDNKPVQPSVPIRPPRDKFDAYGEFIASKLRKLDPKSSTFIQTALADLIFKAELGMFSKKSSDKDSVSASSNNNIQRDITTIPHSQSESTCSSSGKENIQPTGPHLPPDFNIFGSENPPRNVPNQSRVPPHIPNLPFPPVSNTSPENSVVNAPGPPRMIGNPWPPTVLNVPDPANSTVNNPNTNQNRVPFHVGPPSNVPPVLNPSHSYNKVPYHMTGDEFDAFGEFTATKLRTLDPRSCAFVQTAFADLIFEAELGRFLSEGERSIFANRTNEIIKHMPPANFSEPNSLSNVVSSFPIRYAAQSQLIAPVGFHSDQVPLEVIPNLHSVPR